MFILTGRSRTLPASPHEYLKTQVDEWNRRLQSLEVADGSPNEKEKEEAVGEATRALEKLMQVFGHDS